MDFSAEVDRRCSESRGSDGGDNGPGSVCDEAADNLVEVGARLRCLEDYAMTPEQRHRIDTIFDKILA